MCRIIITICLLLYTTYTYAQPYALAPVNSKEELARLIKQAENGDVETMGYLGDIYAKGFSVPKDHDKAMYWYVKAAEKGDASCMNNIGQLYLNDDGAFQHDYVAAMHWFQKAAAAGNGVAMVNIGTIYEDGLGVTADINTAEEWYLKAGAHNCPDGFAAIGSIYMRREDSAGIAQAIMWFRKGADSGSTMAMNNLANFLTIGAGGLQRDTATAFKLFRQAAEGGNMLACYNLGLCYKEGRGVQQDYATAFEWLMKAAMKGHVNAMEHVATALCKGRGVNLDPVKGLEWYLRAAADSSGLAMNNIGVAYLNGVGVDKSNDSGMAWFVRAANTGYASAVGKLAMMYDKDLIPPDQKNKQWLVNTAQATFRTAANAGNDSAMLASGIMYELGQGTPQDYRQAMQWYIRAADKGNEDAMERIGSLYEYGRGVPQDYKKAVEWYSKMHR